jgi:hypothetical protein
MSLRQVAALFSMCALFSAQAWAQATLNKCIDTQGKVTYSNLPCRDAREARKVVIDPVPQPDRAAAQPARVQTAQPPAPEPAAVRLETQRSTGKPAPRASAQQCDTLSDKLGRVLDKMDQARRQGYSQAQMNKWNEEVRELERKKQQSGCF